jgi:hypothetical protein
MMSRSTLKRLIVQTKSMPKYGIGQFVYYNHGYTSKITDIRYSATYHYWMYEVADYWYSEKELKLVGVDE